MAEIETAVASRKQQVIDYLQSVPKAFFEAYCIEAAYGTEKKFQMDYNSDLIKKYRGEIIRSGVESNGYFDVVFDFDGVNVRVTFT